MITKFAPAKISISPNTTVSRLVDVARRPQHDEERVPVALELRPLVRHDGVLDGELVQAESARDLVQLLARGLVEPDPRHRRPRMAGGEEVGDRETPGSRTPSR